MFSGFSFLIDFSLYLLFDISNHLNKFPIFLLSQSTLSLNVSVKRVQLFLNALSQLRRVLLSFSTFQFNILLKIKNSLFHFFSNHFNIFTLLTGYLLKGVTDLYELLVWLFYPLLNFLISLTLLFLYFFSNLFLNIFYLFIFLSQSLILF